ncbi:MAG TPA: class I SAM-dependent methyltransferase [Gemmatimonadaceae bacterium]|jgi:SAM-dependent methyltransferase|nr:class I SAM-dependent methyltransferase [Gemmatimonadaceae bacterium]
MDRHLLRRFLEIYPFQPATAVWRASEVAALARAEFPAGLGLDLGCGDGRLTRVLSDQVGGLRLVGIDVDPMETALAQNERLYERVHTTSAEHIPEPDASFDFVVSVSVMEHIPNLQAVLNDAARVLKPGGRLITTVPSVGFHGCLRGPLLPGSSRDEYLEALDRRVAHVNYWTTATWQAALERAGMRLLEARPILARDEMRRWETLSRLTAGVLEAASGGKRPIEIQRSLGMRRAGQRMPKTLAALLAGVLSVGLDDSAPPSERESGCLLVVAERRRASELS